MQHPIVNGYIARTIIAERQAEAEAYRRTHPRRERLTGSYDRVTIRCAGSADVRALERLAALEHRPLPTEESALVAEVDGEVRAARWLDSGRVLSDPFRPTAELVSLLEVRADHLGYRPRLRRFGLVRRARTALRGVSPA
jgi:hypothetical protein